MAILRKKLMTTVIAGAMAVALVAGGGTYAFLKRGSESVRPPASGNETNAQGAGEDTLSAELTETTGDQYRITPGVTDPQDPAVYVNSNVKSFVFASVDNNTEQFADYQIDPAWKALTGYKDVYYQVAEAELDADGSPKKQRFGILKDDAVSYEASLQNKDMTDENGKLKTGLNLSFAGFSIAANPFLKDSAGNPVDEETAAYLAFENAPIPVCGLRYIADETPLKNMLAKAEQNDTVKLALTDDLTVSDKTISPVSNLELDGGGHAITVPNHFDNRAGLAVLNTNTADKTPLTLSLKNLTLDAIETTYGIRFYRDNPINMTLDHVNVSGAEGGIYLNSGKIAITANNSSILSGKQAVIVSASNIELTFTDCTFTSGKAFTPISINSGCKNITINLINCTVETNGKTANDHFSVAGENVTIHSVGTTYKTNGAVVSPSVSFGSDAARDSADITFDTGT